MSVKITNGTDTLEVGRNPQGQVAIRPIGNEQWQVLPIPPAMFGNVAEMTEEQFRDTLSSVLPQFGFTLVTE